ncbi:hypothetical protein CAL12_10395 [Bordetella genomosp. 8]|uniref:DUF4238 domain-containing protein n=1 Tax=Bordetella genomosp. 8 TaxID=1416806 RepID=A0A1W6YJR0_9BORD|nr:DUF4238 domain-containing protein [Bordetella genomosp. 8]ARP81209.1 hypothetical protein CAL12_10395 [Bordetella genomosp. 8]
MSAQITRNNHYVPQWYQSGFLSNSEPKLWYLDTTPEVVTLDGGKSYTKKGLHHYGTKSCFYEYDLYTTRFGSFVSDEVERLLFGDIDIRGARAVRALIKGEVDEVTNTFQDFFEYMNAQLLRTPKGLDWIKARYPALSQVDLMIEMQSLRVMHGTIWTESVREIVSASASDLKFLVSDCPVTLYNPATPPSSPRCAYPNDPRIDWQGTQTIFPLDANHCLILTHLDHAEAPSESKLTTPRVHARFGGFGIARTDAFIRRRTLSQTEVAAVNVLLKARARRYIAASRKEWLYPEREFNGSWQQLATVLRPTDDLWRFGGQIYVKFEDGSVHHQDQYGRTSNAHEYLRKEPLKTTPHPNDPCGCGSGRKYKQCCKNIPLHQRASWTVYSIRERNLMFSYRIEAILGLKDGATWDDVRRTLSDDQVKDIHLAFASLWPQDTDPTELLPRPLVGKTRAVYLGASDPRTIVATVTSWLPYFDQIVLVHPFLNPRRMKAEFSPVHSPTKHRAQTLKNIFLLFTLEPFIRDGCVHLIPDPADINPEFGHASLKMAESRTANWNLDKANLGWLERLHRDEFGRQLRSMPEPALRTSIKDWNPDLSDADVDLMLAAFKAQREDDPLALLQDLPTGEDNGQLLYSKALSLESALFLATLTGSFVYSELRPQIEQFELHAASGDQMQNSEWTAVQEILGSLDLTLEFEPRPVREALAVGRFSAIKEVIRKLSYVGQCEPSAGVIEQLVNKLQRAATANEKEWAGMKAATRGTGRLTLSAPHGGFFRHEVQRLLITFGKTEVTRPVPFAFQIKISRDDAPPEEPI